MTICWILTSTHKHHIISLQYPSHKCLTEKSCLDCLRILIMSWLYKNQQWPRSISIMPHQTGKKWPKNINLPKRIFSWKPTNKSFMYLLAPFILQNSKKFLEPIELWRLVIFRPKITHLPCIDFFGTNHVLLLPSTGHSHCAKFKKKILSVDPELWGCPIFGPKMVHLSQFFFY